MKRVLEFSEHQKAGLLFKIMGRAVQELLALFMGGGFSAKSPAPQLRKVLDNVLEGKSRAEEILFRDHPDKADTDVYYGPLPPCEKTDEQDNVHHPRAYQLIDAAKVKENMSTIVDVLPQTESRYGKYK